MNDEMKPRVIFPSKNKHFDLSLAEPFGDLVQLVDGRDVEPTEVQAMSNLFGARLHELRFNPDVDIIGLTGNSVMIAVLLAVASEYSEVRVLIYDSGKKTYVLKNLSW